MDIIVHLSSGCEIEEMKGQMVSEPGHSCEECSDIFDTENDLRNHVEKYHEETANCMFCQFVGSKMELVAHLSNECEIDTDEEQMVSGPEETCQECGDVFDTVGDLKTHEEKHHEGLKSCRKFVVLILTERRVVCFSIFLYELFSIFTTFPNSYHNGIVVVVTRSFA